MISRRSLLRSTAGAAASAVMVLPATCVSAVATEPDPIFAAIEFHRAARVTLNDAIDFDEEPETWEVEDEAEQDAWDAFAHTHPTTMAGVAAMAAYALHSPAGEEEGRHGSNLRNALRTIASVTAKFARDAERTQA